MIPPEIKILPDDVANKIAAGEVVERPSSVVKELLENSIDAGATRIDIEFKHGGKTFIKILDNGCGMTRQQALMSLEQHATSKIVAPDDLFKISSYGFRGEAVPSIASVSKFRMRTRPESESFGVQIDCYASEVLSVKECGMARGTEIIVENLFSGVPARRKFLKSDNVEAGHIIRLCRLYALAKPELSITLIENSKVLFRSDGGLGVVARVSKIFGKDIAENFVELKSVEKFGMKVSGAIVVPGESFTTSRNICTFINGRPVECRAVYAAVKEAYLQLVPKNRFAGAFLFLELNPSSVDVNVHPAKREVRLKDEFAVKDFLAAAIADRLKMFSFAEPFGSNARQEPKDSRDNETSATVSAEIFNPNFSLENPPVMREPYTAIESADFKPAFVPSPNFGERENYRGGALQPQAADDALDGWRYLGCYARRYALFESAKSLVLMSIVGALRRVNFNCIMNALEGRKAVSQKLLLPINISFSSLDGEFFRANRELFESCGFEIEDFGKDYYRIAAIPAWLEFSESEKFVRDIVESSGESGVRSRARRLGDEIFASMAVSHTGIGAFVCDEVSATRLLRNLLLCPMHMTSPDGRKTLCEFSAATLARLFGEGL